MRFRVKFGLALFSAVAAVLTAVWSDWIELAFRWSPDHGSGSAEWLIVGLSRRVLGASGRRRFPGSVPARGPAARRPARVGSAKPGCGMAAARPSRHP